MSGGYFRKIHLDIEKFSDELKEEINGNDDKTKTMYDETVGMNFSPETIANLWKIVGVLDKVGPLAKAVDYLYSGDHSEDTFNKIVDNL